ncbi:hypothetical protein D9M73_239890 [compost metagenome]
MWNLGAGQPVATDQHEWLAAGAQRAGDIQLLDQQLLDTTFGQRGAEILMDQAHHFAFFLTAYAIEEQWSVLGELQAHAKAPAPGGQCQALWTAAAMAGSHVDGGGFAPQA